MVKSEKSGALKQAPHGGAREGAGRPAIGARRVNVSLDDATLKRAAEIGAGNVSDGLRKAVAAYFSASITE